MAIETCLPYEISHAVNRGSPAKDSVTTVANFSDTAFGGRGKHDRQMSTPPADKSKTLVDTGTEDAFLADSSNYMQRLAAATFLAAEPLALAVQELIAEAIKPDQFCLVGTASRIAETKAAIAAPDQLLSDAGREALHDHHALPDATRLVAEPANFDQVDFGLELQPQGLLHGLETTLAHGAIALIVKTRSVTEFATATRVLLRYSTQRVRTREVLQPHPTPD